jgi:prevent-host-death family protein
VQVNILEAKNRLSQLIKAARAGEEVVIANRGQPMVRLVPAERVSAEPPLGSPQRLLAWLQEHRRPESARRSAAEIDADIAAERQSWD